MFTDFYFTNTSTSGNNNCFVLFQKSRTTDFISIENCQYRWSHRIRFHWDLSFRFLKKSRNTTPVYNLKTSYTKQRIKKFLSKEGIISMQQSYGNGKQVLDFEQIKGNEFIAIQLYRGELLIDEQYFKGKYLNFQIDSIISITQGNFKNKSLLTDMIKTVLDFDFTGLKSIYLTLVGDKNTRNEIRIDTVEKW